MDYTVLNMPLAVNEGSGIRNAQPISALVVVKAMRDDGSIFYQVISTEDLQVVEGVGMIEFARNRMQRRM